MPTAVVLEAEENSLERRQRTFSRKEKEKTKQEVGGYRCGEQTREQRGWRYQDSQPAASLAGSILSAEPWAPRRACSGSTELWPEREGARSLRGQEASGGRGAESKEKDLKANLIFHQWLR